MYNELSIKEAYLNFWKKAFQLKGRARRKEYWIPNLIHIAGMFIITFILYMIGMMLGKNIDTWTLPENILNILSLIIFIPSMTIMVRRFHDINLSGWWVLITTVVSIFLTIVGVFLTVMGMIASFSDDNAVGAMIAGFCMLLILGVMSLVVFILTLLPGTRGTNKYGYDPKEYINREEYYNDRDGNIY